MLGDLLKQLFTAFAAMLDASYTALYTAIVGTITNSSVPTLETFRSEWVRNWLGNTVGLARAVIVLATVVVTLLVASRPFRPHGKKVANLFTSMMGLLVFMMLFYPACDLVLAFSASMKDWLIGLITQGKPDALTQYFQLAVPVDDVFGKIISLFILNIVGLFAMVSAFTVSITLFLVAVSYPLAVALKAFGGLFEGLYHAANATLVAVVLAPPLMAFFVCLPLLVQQLPLGGIALARVIATGVGCLLAAICPIVLTLLAYQRSQEVFGTIDAKIAGAVDVSTMPSVSLEEYQNYPSSGGSLKVFGESMLVGSVTVLGSSGGEDIGDALKHVAADALAAGATAAGHPVAGTVIQGLDSASRIRSEKKNADADVPDQTSTP